VNRARMSIEDAIESLIGVLDLVDGDSDLEPEASEDQFDDEADPAEDGIGDEAALVVVLVALSRR